MDYTKLNGTWSGYYKYGDHYPEEFKLGKEPFTLELTFDDANFKGICKDKFTESYFNKPATVEGTFVPNLISFIKRYPSLLTVDDKMQTIVIPDKPSLEIHYTGLYYKSFFSKTIRIVGEWTMTNLVLTESGKKDYFTFDGTWMMQK